MTSDDRFGRTLSTWLHEEAEHKMPDHLAEVLVQTVAIRQRPWWSSLERLIPMTSMTTGRVQARPTVFWFALIALVALAAVGAVLIAGSFRATPTPIGPASNGRIVVADGSSLVSYAADGTDRSVLLETSARTAGLSISPDGTRVAFTVPTTPPSVHVVSIADGSITDIDVTGADMLADHSVSWSSDGSSVVFTGLDGTQDQVYVAAVDGSSVTTPIEGQLPPGLGIWHPAYSPDGEWIAFATDNQRTDFGELYVMRPDGSELRSLPVPHVETGDGGGPLWSPATDVHRIAYLTFANGALVTRVFDVDTNTDRDLGPGFWPSWSPDGKRLATCCATVVDVEAALAQRWGNPITLFGQPPDYGPDAQDAWTGRAIRSAVVWSPDGDWLIAADIAGQDLLILPADGSAAPRRVELEAVSEFTGPYLPVAWQPVWP